MASKLYNALDWVPLSFVSDLGLDSVILAWPRYMSTNELFYLDFCDFIPHFSSILSCSTFGGYPSTSRSKSRRVSG